MTMDTSDRRTGSSSFGRGDVITSRELTTIQGEPVLLPAPDGLTHLQFRRFAGCPICNVHLRSVAVRHEEIAAAGIHEIVVFHSSAEDMLPHQGALPFAVIADPDKQLYRAFGVESSLLGVLHPGAWGNSMRPSTFAAVGRGLRSGGRPYPTKGENLTGMPADLLIGPDRRVLAAKYGKHAGDQWPVDELLSLAAAAG